jgi:hypothetical protein
MVPLVALPTRVPIAQYHFPVFWPIFFEDQHIISLFYKYLTCGWLGIFYHKRNITGQILKGCSRYDVCNLPNLFWGPMQKV